MTVKEEIAELLDYIDSESALQLIKRVVAEFAKLETEERE